MGDWNITISGTGQHLDTKATTDEGATRAAKAWLARKRAEAAKWRCKSCGAGGVLLVGVEYVVPERRRAVAL